uniref:beta-mannosidase n=1 Tax=Phallusia mammillata TaxID=59560 RepID=A0A6F9DKE6_9ASCI|nr:beta-mannosidase [Phallusia mammillata]
MLQIVLFLFLLRSVHCHIWHQDLGGSTWTASGVKPPSNVIIQLSHTQVPGCVHTDWMYGKGPTDNPYYGFNDVNLRWIAETDWKYSRTFSLPAEFLTEHEQWLVFEGVDTFANITLNGKVVGQTHDMFITYRFNVTGLLQATFNMLTVSFTSAINYAGWEVAKQPYSIPPNCPPDVQHGICHVNLIRKEQCSFSWDWGPAFATQGIWKPVYVASYSRSILTHATATYNWDKNQLLFDLKFQVSQQDSKLPVHGNVSISIPQLKVSKIFPNITLSQVEGSTSVVNLNIDMSKVAFKRWWPNGYGDANLYNVSVNFTLSDGMDVSSRNFRFGFRKVELVQEPINGSTGLSFYFKINDKALFVKGANWIPADAFKNRITLDRYSNILSSARVAHMNMLRVWGGGVYEDDRFYQLADEMGIMIWQDFMFACALYPTSQNFLSNITQEVHDQIWRLKHHASIVTWAGNNENEAALATDWYNTTDHFDRYKKDYVTLYVDTIRATVTNLDNSRPFLTSSPTNAKETQEEGWVAKDPYSKNYGDVHYYNYNDDCLDWTKYPKTRFASEYGFQSWPSFESLLPVSEPRDWTLDSDWTNHRQHHGNGNMQMTNQIKMHFDLPTVGNSTQIFKDTIYLTQIMQALCYKSETEFYRRSRNEIVDGVGHTMGALYWQLNDIWQAPTWSSTEYGGKWKALHYYATKFFAPVTLIAYDDDTQLTVYSASDVDVGMNGTLLISVRSWQQFDPLYVFKKPVVIPPNQSTQLLQESVGSILHYGQCPYKELCYLTISVMEDTSILPTSFFPVIFKDIQGISKPEIKVSKVEELSKNLFSVELKSSSPALFVWVEAVGIRGRFSDNGFVMYEATVNITFHSWDETLQVDSLKESLTVKSFADIYQQNNTSDDDITSTDSGDDVTPYTWLDDVTAKLTFAVIGLLFIVMAAVQTTCLVLRLNKPSRRASMKPRLVRNTSFPSTSGDITRQSSFASSRSENVINDVISNADESMAFLIQSKKGYGHEAKKTEIRFYVI